VTAPDKSPYPPPPCESQWPKQVEVFSSSSQNHYSYYTFGNVTEGRESKSFYSQALRECLNTNQTDSPGQCHAEMRSWNTNGWNGPGYRNSWSFQSPTSSADALFGECLSAWDKKDHSKTRFALLLSGENLSEKEHLLPKRHHKHHRKHGDATVFDTECQRWKTMLNEQYPGTTILDYPNANSRQVEQGLKQIQRQISKITKGKNAIPKENIEVMIYYVGHGQAYESAESHATGREGSATGILEFRDGIYSEASLKSGLQNHLPDITTTVIVNSCQSGAFTA
jgi:hypothetical protein